MIAILVLSVLLLASAPTTRGGPGFTPVPAVELTPATSSVEWSNITSAQGPPAGYGPLVFDAADGYVLYFDMYLTSTLGPPGCAPDELWSFLHGTWTELPDIGGPVSYGNALLAYDAADGYVVLVGGCGAATNQTWTYSGGHWTSISSGPSPPTGYNGDLVYDPSIGAVVLFDDIVCSTGCLGGLHAVSVTWEFRNGAWQNVTSSIAPPADADYGLAYDPSSGALVLAGGVGPCIPPGPDGFRCSDIANTWIFQDGWWLNSTGTTGPPPRVDPGLAEDGATDGAILFGGAVPIICPRFACVYNDTWSFSEGMWKELPIAGPPNRSGAAMAYDPIDGYLVLRGGLGYTGVLNDTWILNGTLSPHPSGISGLTEQGAVLIGLASGGFAAFAACLVVRIRRR